jgi:hypothetical protein
VILAGLVLRSGKFPLESGIVKYGGDALWALVVFLCLGVAWPSWPTYRVGGVAMCVSWAVEFLQLYHAPWIDAIRAMVIGRLILGASFNPPDLVAYVAGILLGVVVERVQASSCLSKNAVA